MITAIEASGKNKDENYVWDSADFEGYVKGSQKFHTVLLTREVAAPLPLSGSSQH